MKKRLLIIFSIIFFQMISPAFSQVKTINWVKETNSAAWRPRDSQSEFVFKNQLWILGGWDTPQTPNFLDVWKSSDGKSWINTTKTAPWGQSDLSASLVFKNKMWIMGGRKVPGTECSNKVWSSADGVNWELVTEAANWSPRLSPGFVVFKNRMWILGGTSDFYKNNDSTLFNDVWSSGDGKEWKLELMNAPWSKRAHAQTIVFNNKIWLIGGGQRFPNATAHNDVWCSEDGINWKQVTPSAQWLPRMWFSSVVYRDRIWVIGGWSGEHKNFDDVWYSKNGIDWKELKTEIHWSKRHEHSAFVFKDKLWIAGGAAGDDYILNSEVWSLYIDKNWFKNN
ncbi:MAG: galactose oxidase [Sphingobacteriales bacterium UTBCD1]|nr:MAG: galactose oxidase [Sphingobacteriales bacterium UTBCD1]